MSYSLPKLLLLMHAKSIRRINVEALETQGGIRKGDRVTVPPFLQADGNMFPGFTGTVEDVRYELSYDLSYYRIKARGDAEERFASFEAAERYFVKIGDRKHVPFE